MVQLNVSNTISIICLLLFHPSSSRWLVWEEIGGYRDYFIRIDKRCLMKEYKDAELTKVYWMKYEGLLDHSFIVAQFTDHLGQNIAIRLEGKEATDVGTAGKWIPILTEINVFEPDEDCAQWTDIDPELHGSGAKEHVSSKDGQNLNRIKFGDIGHIWNFMIRRRMPYDLLYNNCHYFAQELYEILTGQRINEIPDSIKLQIAQLVTPCQFNEEWVENPERNWGTNNECPQQFNDDAFERHLSEFKSSSDCKFVTEIKNTKQRPQSQGSS